MSVHKESSSDIVRGQPNLRDCYSWMGTNEEQKDIPLNETIFAERADISSHPSLSRRALSTS